MSNSPADETIEKTIDILEQKKQLLAMFVDLQTVCQAILAKAKKDPSKVRASLLKEVVISLKACREMTTFAQQLENELAMLDGRKKSNRYQPKGEGGGDTGPTADEMLEMEQTKTEIKRIEEAFGMDAVNMKKPWEVG